MIEIKDLSKNFAVKDGNFTAIYNIDLTIQDGDVFGIIGMSGAGKSTLIRCLNLLERPSSGSICVDGKDITHYQGRQLLQLRRSMGMIFQKFNLLMQRTNLENVALPMEICGVTKDKRLARAQELLELVGLGDQGEKYPIQRSGGQQQRVSIARALANDPKVLLCDEPTSALDSLTTNSILKLLRDINRQLGVTIVIITHEIGVVEKICNRVAVMDASVIVEQGTVAEVMAHPTQEITKKLLGRVRWDA
ncbi:MAG: ATP-binding cassette domain-containing protein [Clostridiales bacterium]|nr:ATP-binding cassette domain-containing protein [Clostridiales bacterium]